MTIYLYVTKTTTADRRLSEPDVHNNLFLFFLYLFSLQMIRHLVCPIRLDCSPCLCAGIQCEAVKDRGERRIQAGHLSPQFRIHLTTREVRQNWQ